MSQHGQQILRWWTKSDSYTDFNGDGYAST
jgi:hypothetical protein